MEALSYCQLMERCLAAEARVAEVTAENVTLKDINAWCKTDAFKNMYREFKTAESLGCSDVDCMHDAMLVAIMHAPETPATDRIVSGIKADGVEEFAAYCGEENSVFVEAKAYYRSLPDAAYEFCSMLRENKSEGVKS